MEVNVESIMQEIREQIKTSGLNNSKLSFEDISPHTKSLGTEITSYDEETMVKTCAEMNMHYEVSVWHPINSTRPVIGPCLTFGKKVMRKLTRFFVQAIVEDQNRFNMHITRSMNQARNYLIQKEQLITEFDKQIDELLVKQAALNDKLIKLEKENAELKKERH